MPSAAIPYEEATTGERAREEITNMLRRYGAQRVGFMDEFDTHTLILYFEHKGRPVQLKASAQGWANLYLQHHPWTTRRRSTKDEWERKALQQGQRAVNSILRDWVKGQITAIECGLLTFENVFLPHMLLADGQSIGEALEKKGLALLDQGKDQSAHV